MMFLDPCLFMPLARSANIRFYFGSFAQRDLAAACESHCSLSRLCVECVSATELHAASCLTFSFVSSVSAMEHHAASCLTFSFVSSVSLPWNIMLHPVSLNFSSVSSMSLPQNIKLHPVSPFPLCPVCLCHGTSYCILSHLFLCTQRVFATEHHAASCESQLFLCIQHVFVTEHHTASCESQLFLCIQHVSATEHQAASCLAFSFVSSVSLPRNIMLHPASLNFPCLTFSSVSSLFLLQISCCILWVSPFPLYLLVLPSLYATVHSKTVNSLYM